MRKLSTSLAAFAASAGAALATGLGITKTNPTTGRVENVPPKKVLKHIGRNRLLPKQQQVDIQDRAEAKRLRKMARPDGWYNG